MINCRTEIEETMIRPGDWTVREGLRGLKVITSVSEYKQKKRPVDVNLPDGNRSYGRPYIFELKRDFTLVDEYPSVDDFKKAIESERLIQLTKSLTYLSVPSLLLLNNVNNALASVVFAGLLIYPITVDIAFSRFKLPPHKNKAILESEIYAFTHTYPDQKLRNYNPWTTVKNLLSGSKIK